MKPNTAFKISVLDPKPIPIPTDRFSVRQNSAIWFDGYYYLYADVIPWDNPYPGSCDTSVHLFKSADAENWEYLGEVIGKGKPGEWTANGIGTPGACVFQGKVYVPYKVVGNRDGSGHRFIGISVADNPAGPFRELPELRIIPRGVDYLQETPTLLLDDPYLVPCNADGTGPGNERLYIYYRRSLNDFLDPEDRAAALEYGIRTRYVVDFRGLWSDPHPVVTAKKRKVVETTDVRWINGRLVMLVLGYDQGLMAVYVSSNSRDFVPAEPHLLESYLDIYKDYPCFCLPGFIQDPDGQVRHMTAVNYIDDQGHWLLSSARRRLDRRSPYTIWVYRIECK